VAGPSSASRPSAILLRTSTLRRAGLLDGQIATVLNGDAQRDADHRRARGDELVTRTTAQEDKRMIHAVHSLEVRRCSRRFLQNAARLKDSWTPLTDREKQQLVNMTARLRIHFLAKNAGDELGIRRTSRPKRRPQRQSGVVSSVSLRAASAGNTPKPRRSPIPSGASFRKAEWLGSGAGVACTPRALAMASRNRGLGR
jgi:hypothetical protein